MIFFVGHFEILFCVLSIQLFFQILMGIPVFFLFVGFLCIFWMLALAQIFYLWLPFFTLLMVSFDEQVFLVLMKSNVSVFSFLVSASPVLFKEALCLPKVTNI